MQKDIRLGWAYDVVTHRGHWCVSVAALWALIWLSFPPQQAHAQAHLGTDALPGLVSVPSASESPLVSGMAGVGYGFTGEVLGLNDAHHKVTFEGAASAAPLPQLILAGALGARLDGHTGTGSADTSGFATYGSFTVRGRFEAADGVHVGLELVGVIPASEDAVRSLRSFTPEANGMATYETERFRLSGALGTRINRSDRAFGSGTTLSPYEAIALARSDDPQLLVGVGGAVAAGPLWCLMDLQFEPYLGSGAPAIAQAPALLGLGVRSDVRPWLQLGLQMRVSLSPYPAASEVATTPVPPRVAAQGFVALRWDKPEPVPAVQESPPEPAAATEAEPAPPAAPATASLTGDVMGLHGHAIPDASVRVQVRRGDVEHSLTLQGGTTEFAFPELDLGDWELRAEADGYQPSSRTVRLPVNKPVQIRLDRALPPGHLEVRVQDFRGRQVDARVVVLPDRTPFQPTAETGLYGLDLAPGEYDIEIVAEGYAPETRSAVVAQNGVTIVVVDLRRAQETP